MANPASRVLVVDDDATLRDTLEQALLAEGYDVEAASNGLEALSVLPSWQPDLIILDLMMPIMDGWRFRDEQRRTASANVPLLILTGHRDVATATSELGATETIRKPFDIDDLLSTVHRIIS